MTFAQKPSNGMDMDSYTQYAAIGVLVFIVMLFIIILYLSEVVTKEEIAADEGKFISPPAARSGLKSLSNNKPNFARVFFVLIVMSFVYVLILGLILFG